MIKTFAGFADAVPRTTAGRDELDKFELPGGHGLPQSYCDFAENLGYGLTCGLFIVYIPMGDHCDSLTTRSQVLANVNRQAVGEEFMDFSPDGSAELVLRLVPFAISENGHVLAWDLADSNHDEYAIYRIGPRACGVRRAAKSLYELIESCLDDRVREVLGPGYKPLPLAFEGYEPA